MRKLFPDFLISLENVELNFTNLLENVKKILNIILKIKISAISIPETLISSLSF